MKRTSYVAKAIIHDEDIIVTNICAIINTTTNFINEKLQ